jgi:holliday junction DNA helicase RuvB
MPYPKETEVSAAGSPATINHFTGQRRVCRQVQVALDAAWADGTRIPHLLFSGPPGLGKTLLSQIIAAEMGSELRTTLGQCLRNPMDLYSFLIEAEERDVLLIDEADELFSSAQTALFRALEDGYLFVPGGHMSRVQQIPLESFSMILCTNHEGVLAAPLRERFRLTLRFEYYSPDELTVLLHQRAYALGWTVTDDLLNKIAQLGRGTPRVALRLLESCWRLARSQRKDEIDEGIFEDMLDIEDIDRHWGLDRVERSYLSVLTEGNSSTRLQTLCRRLGIPRQSLVNITEDYLVRAGLIHATDMGRQLTELGQTCVEQIQTVTANEGDDVE